MNSSEHTGIGIIAFLIYPYGVGNIVSSINHSWIWGLVAVIIGSLIPDIIEPATSSRHRGLFHSVGALIAMIFLFGSTTLIAVIIAFFSEFSVFYIISCFLL